MNRIYNVSCDRCALAVINGIPCHEQGCDARSVTYTDQETGESWEAYAERRSDWDFEECDT